MFSYRHPNRADRRAFARVDRLLSGDSPADKRRRELHAFTRRTHAERRAHVRRQIAVYAIRVGLSLLPVALAAAYVAGLTAAR